MSVPQTAQAEMCVRTGSVAAADEAVLIDVVSTNSVSGCEREAVGVFIRHAIERGFRTEIDEAGNAIAHRGPADARTHIVMLGHIDTVPGDIPVRVDRGVLHGRGSVDAKGPLCAMLCAAHRADLPEGIRVSVIGAVGEEAASPGARYLAPRLRPAACIIGEPSGWDGVTLGYKGRLVAAAAAECDNGHSAGQSLSASDEVVAWWSRVQELVEGFNAGRTRVFEAIQSTIQSMDSACDGMTQRASLQVGFRLPVDMPPETLAERLEALADGQVILTFQGHERAHTTDRNDPVVRALSTAIRSTGGRPRPKHKTGTADLNVVAPVWACPIAAYGPGDSALDHTPNEHLHLDEYHRSIGVLAGAIVTLGEELRGGHAGDPNPE